MKMLIGGIAAILTASTVLAQPAPPVGPAAPAAPAPFADPAASSAPAPAAPSAEPAPPAASEQTAIAPILTERNGKWWNGDRKASKAEIAENQRNRPQ
ncbi:MAG: hypothetical protein H7267_03805 [Sandarakinorhabdus sp.]|nr:hypothetical protein [Sandarakinorhabdus sp.]